MTKKEVMNKLREMNTWLEEEAIKNKYFPYDRKDVDDPMLGWVNGLTDWGRAQRQAIRALYEDSCLALEVFDDEYDTNRDE